MFNIYPFNLIKFKDPCPYKKKKSNFIAYMLLALFGIIGLHRFYLNKKYAQTQFFLGMAVFYCVYYLINFAFLVLGTINPDIINSSQMLITQNTTFKETIVSFLFLNILAVLGFWCLYDSIKIPYWVEEINKKIELENKEIKIFIEK